MEDLLAPQIHDSCRLALPEGLKNLMSDISREVLRYQPRNLYQFIADYLSALLVTRDNLSVAGYICSDICKCSCDPELESELREIGLSDDDIKTATEIITNYFQKGPVQEANLLLKLLKKNVILEYMMPEVQAAIRKAFLRHQAYNTTIYESSSDSGEDEMTCAVKHTLNLYRKTAPTEESYEIMMAKIQNSYRAFGVKRGESKDYTLITSKKSYDSLTIPKRSSSYDITYPKMTSSECALSEESWIEDVELAFSSSMSKKRLTTISSTSLAGSFMNLPTHHPYSAHDGDVLSNLEEHPEKEHTYIDYTDDNPHISTVTDKLPQKKKISFSDPMIEEPRRDLAGYDSCESKDSNDGAISDESNNDVEEEKSSVNVGEASIDDVEELDEIQHDVQDPQSDVEILEEIHINSQVSLKSVDVLELVDPNSEDDN